jgi:hypothetical protein
MTSQKRPSRAKMLTAIASTGGVISRISAKLNYSWHATKAAIEADEVVKQAYLDECERVDDLAESVLIASFARQDNPDTDTAKWWLKSRRRAKFGDAVDVTSGGEKINPYMAATTEELRQMAQRILDAGTTEDA